MLHALPSSKASADARPSAPPRAPDSRTRPRPRALLVDDDQSTREMYAWCLLAAGWHVETAGDGEEALRIAPLFQPDAIVMDLRLPGIDGLEATRRLKLSSLTRAIPVVGCSGFDLEQSETLSRLAGCEAFVAKPCPPDELRAVLEGLLGLPKD
ncbi:MAG: response regulator [Polyangiaceae bacterium]